MIDTPIRIKRALISVSNKNGIVEFAKQLKKSDIEIISTGGTANLLRQENIEVTDVTHITQFPEMMDGRVKTLHPNVHAGILGLRDKHQQIATEHKINWIDLVVVNLYPFAETISKPDSTFTDAIENIDIGGPAMIRSAAKNMQWCTVVVDPKDYAAIVSELEITQTISSATRKRFASKAFQHTANYDATIFSYLQNKNELRYGENPHQSARVYQTDDSGILAAHQHQGKQLSYNNLLDANAALECLQEFSEPTAVIIKHTIPCGVSSANDLNTALQQALNSDKKSAFGGVVAMNGECDDVIAKQLTELFLEIIIAPRFTSEALTLFKNKKNLRILESKSTEIKPTESKTINGGMLIQDKDLAKITSTDLTLVTQLKPTPQQIDSMLFAWHTLKHVKSNAIVIAKDKTTVGIGAGQVSRIDAVEIAIRKACDAVAQHCVLASDAFFPFRDSIDRIAKTGIKAIIQPGGSVQDHDVITACNEHQIAMVFTGKRCFKH